MKKAIAAEREVGPSSEKLQQLLSLESQISDAWQQAKTRKKEAAERARIAENEEFLSGIYETIDDSQVLGLSTEGLHDEVNLSKNEQEILYDWKIADFDSAAS